MKQVKCEKLERRYPDGFSPAARIVMTAQNFDVSVRSIALGAAARSTRGKRTVSAAPAGRHGRRKHSGIGAASIIVEQERRTTNDKM